MIAVKEITNKWKSYRDAHLKYLRKRKNDYSQKYIHADLLTFLEDNGCFRRRKIRWMKGKPQENQEDATFEEDQDSIEDPLQFIKTELTSGWSENQNSSSASNYSQPSFPPDSTCPNQVYHMKTTNNVIQHKVQLQEEQMETYPKRPKLELEGKEDENYTESPQWTQTSENANPSEECTKNVNHQKSAQTRLLQGDEQQDETIFVDENLCSSAANSASQLESGNPLEENDDMFFFRSLVPAVKHLTTSKKLSFRIQVLLVLQNLTDST